MNSDVRIKIGLDTGELASGAGRAKQYVSDLTDKIIELRKEGKHTEAFRLELSEHGLQGKAARLEQSVKTVANDPRFQTTLPNGDTAIKVDPEYANLIKSHNETLRKFTDEQHEALRAGNIERVHELNPQIGTQYSAINKTFQDIIKTNGNFPQKLPSGNTDQGNPQVPPLPGNDDWRNLKGLSGAITQEHDVGNWERVSRLGNTKDALRGIMGEYDRDSKLEAKIKADPELASQLKEIRDALKGTIAAIDDAAANGEYRKVEQLTGQAKQLQGISHKTVQEAAATPGSKKARDTELSSFLNVQTAQQIVGAVTSGINTYVAHLDRSSIVNAMGGGDVMGAQIDELHRSAAEKSALWGSVGRIGGAIIPGLIATVVSGGNPIVGGIAASLGSTLFGAGGELIGTLGDEKKANEMATSEAYAKLWERQAPSAMELTALLGKYGGTSAENTRTLRHTWENAANTATGYGFSPEEGIEQVKQAAYQGLNEGQALDAARDVFAFERGTGADRGTLSEFRNKTERFGGASDGLNKAWQGNQASGMAPAQFNEFLRSMQRTFEDGISKGFVRGAGEIAGNFAFLSDLNGGSELWKGEQGANRLSQMNAGLAATTGLASASDILSFRGAQSILDQWDAQGDAKERWESIGNLDGKKENGLELRRGYDYIDTMAILERGLTPELFHSQMQMIEGVEGQGNRTGAVEQMRNIYGLNYTGSAALYQSYQDKLKTFGGDTKAVEDYFSGAEWAKKLESFKDNPDYNNSTERTMFEHVADIKKYTYQIGEWHLDEKIPTLAQELVKAWKEAREKGATGDTGPGGGEPGNPDKPDDPSKDKPFPPTPVEQTLEDLKNVATAPPTPGEQTGDIIRTATNNATAAQVHEVKAQQDIIHKAKNATKYLFDEGLFGIGLGGEEKSLMDAINATIATAVKSGNPEHFAAAKELQEGLSRYGKDDKSGKPYDEANTFNVLAQFRTNIIEMLDKFREVAAATEKAAEEMNKAKVDVFETG